MKLSLCCSRRLQPSTGARQMPPVRGLNFQCNLIPQATQKITLGKILLECLVGQRAHGRRSVQGWRHVFFTSACFASPLPDLLCLAPFWTLACRKPGCGPKCLRHALAGTYSASQPLLLVKIPPSAEREGLRSDSNSTRMNKNKLDLRYTGTAPR